MDSFYDELALRLQKDHLQSDPANQKQYWIAIAGGAGSGKTTTATAISQRLNRIEEGCCAVIPLDGFHYSKERLRQLDPPNGANYIKRRGAPWTFDAERTVELLTQARQNLHGIFPSYDRTISDPVEDQVELLASHRIVLIEGIFVLGAKEDGNRWEPLQQLWDETWFCRAPNWDIQRERLIDRALQTWTPAKAEQWGPGAQGAAARVDANDVLNHALMAHCEALADLVIETV